VDDLGEPVQLRTLDRRRPPIPRRYRKAQHLLHALARNPEVTCRLARTHPVPTGETNLQIQFHGENAPALPAARKGKSGRVLLRRYSGTIPPLPWMTFPPPFRQGLASRAVKSAYAARAGGSGLVPKSAPISP